ncbi:hypothetical protein ACO0LL_24490 [Undibacterium sp. TC4M20W]|uniref:hypothetical protein n=1 Tax=Undibacterium sp. TC4M20W TaxID=3413052 RepID=UPI003BF05748
MNTRLSCFLKDLENYWHCESRDAESGSDLLKALRDPRHGINESDFKNLLAEAILSNTLSEDVYLEYIGADFSEPDGISNDLLMLWKLMFGQNTVTTTK